MITLSCCENVEWSCGVDVEDKRFVKKTFPSQEGRTNDYIKFKLTMWVAQKRTERTRVRRNEADSSNAAG